jgi:hypothetical protein
MTTTSTFLACGSLVSASAVRILPNPRYVKQWEIFAEADIAGVGQDASPFMGQQTDCDQTCANPSHTYRAERRRIAGLVGTVSAPFVQICVPPTWGYNP